MTKPNKFDSDINDKKASDLMSNQNKIVNVDSENIWCYSDLDTVKTNFKKHTNSNNVKLIKGDVGVTLKEKKIYQIKYPY